MRERKIINRLERREVYRISVTMVDAPGRKQSGKLAKAVGGGLIDEKAEDTDW